MLYLYKQSETVANRQRVYLHLVSATDGITPATGEAGGQPQLIQNGGTPVNTTNTLVAVDTTNAPGLYYVQLTSSELGNLGFIAVRYKSASTAEFQTVGQVILDDPYVAHTGPGLAVPAGMGKGTAGGMRKEDMIQLAKMIWDVMLEGKTTAKEVLLRKSEFDPAQQVVKTEDDDSPILAKLDTLSSAMQSLAKEEAAEARHEAITDGLNALSLKDYSDQFAAVSARIEGFSKKVDAAVAQGREQVLAAVARLDLAPKLEKTTQALDEAATTAAELKRELDSISESLTSLTTRFNEEIDIERRMERVGNKIQDQAVLEMVKELAALKSQLQALAKRLLTAITEVKFDVKQQSLKL